MVGTTDRIAELERVKADVEQDVHRYRAAAEAALDQLDWCIGYLARNQKGGHARTIAANRNQIIRDYLQGDRRPSSAGDAR